MSEEARQDHFMNNEDTRIILIGHGGIGYSMSKIMTELKAIELNQGKDSHVIVCVDDKETSDRIANIIDGVQVDMEQYIRSKFPIDKKKIFKTGSQSELMLVDYCEFEWNDNGTGQKKKRNKMTHLKRKKKRRK